MKEFEIEGYEQFKEKIEDLEKTVNNGAKIIILFSGSRNSEGVSWCPDCVKAEPVIEELFQKYKNDDDVYFLHVGVGERDFWKDPECIFRTDPKLKLTSVPTILRWNGSQRLAEEECCDEDLLELLFND